MIMGLIWEKYDSYDNPEYVCVAGTLTTNPLFPAEPGGPTGPLEPYNADQIIKRP